MTTLISYCRICQASCGVLVEVHENRIVQIMGDRENPLSQGFTCPKGRRGGDLLVHPERLTRSLERLSSGIRKPISGIDAAHKVGRRLREIIDRHGPEAIGLFLGTQGIFATLTNPMARAWFVGTGSHKLFTTMTIDQSSKWVAAARMGEYRGGRQAFAGADVWLLAGTNPLVSVNGGAGDGVLMQNPTRTLRQARERGLKLIVIDPRRTETAFQADLHLQPRPGYDALIFAGLLNVILTEQLHDRDFCGRHTLDLDRLSAAVAQVTPDCVAQIADLRVADVIGAARLFAAGPRGMATTGTGTCMGPHSNLAEHLATCLNVVCGRFLREGEPITAPAVLGRETTRHAEVAPTDRSWDSGYRSRFGAGLLRGELPSASLADEILEAGPDRLRALVISGGNPLLALPDAEKVKRAFKELELLVVIDPRLSETARLAHFVIAPTLLYERSDHTLLLEKYFAIPYAMYADPIVTPPTGVIEDWQFFWQMARSMGQTITLAGEPIETSSPPTSAQLLAVLARHGCVSLADVAAAPHGLAVDPCLQRVGPPSGEAIDHKLELLPPDVADELATALADACADDAQPLRLVVRRMREVMNSLGQDVDRLPEQPFNPASMHPIDMRRLGLTPGCRARLTTHHGSVVAVVQPDETLRRGIVSLTHGWSGSPAGAVNVNHLTGADSGAQDINLMPVLTGLPVAVGAVE